MEIVLQMYLIFDMRSDYMVSNMESLLEQEVGTEEISEETQVPPEMTSAQLFDEYRHGNKDAFTELYEREKRVGLSVAVHVLHDYQRAEDITQEAWMTIAEKDSFDSSQSFRTWFGRVVYNKCIDYLRKNKSAIRKAHPESALPFDVQDTHKTPQEEAIETEMTEEHIENIRSIYRKLPEHYQQILYLRHVDGMTLREIADIFGKSESTITFHCRRGSGYFAECYRRIILKE